MSCSCTRSLVTIPGACSLNISANQASSETSRSSLVMTSMSRSPTIALGSAAFMYADATLTSFRSRISRFRSARGVLPASSSYAATMLLTNRSAKFIKSRRSASVWAGSFREADSHDEVFFDDDDDDDDDLTLAEHPASS